MRYVLFAVMMLINFPAGSTERPQILLPALHQVEQLHASYRELTAEEKRQLAEVRLHSWRRSPLVESPVPVTVEDLLADSETAARDFVRRYGDNKDSLDPALSTDALDPRLRQVIPEFMSEAIPLALSHLLAQLDGAPIAPIDVGIEELFSDRVLLKAALLHLKSTLEDPFTSVDAFYLDTRSIGLLYPEYQGADFTGVALLENLAVENGFFVTSTLADIQRQYKPKVPGFSLEFPLYVILHEMMHTLLLAGDDSYAYDPEAPVSSYDIYSSERLDPNEKTNADNYVVLIFRMLAGLDRAGFIDLSQY